MEKLDHPYKPIYYILEYSEIFSFLPLAFDEHVLTSVVIFAPN